VGGLSGGVAAATRSVGIALLPALLLEAWPSRRRDFAGALVVLGPMLYGIYWLSQGDMLRPITAQAQWARSLRLPVVTLAEGLLYAAAGIGDPKGFLWTLDFLVTLLALVVLAWGWRILRPSYLVYAGLSLLIPLTYPNPHRPLLSLPRFVIVLFPLFWIPARKLTDRAMIAVVGASLLSYIPLSAGFMNWHFIF
jgi:hypothetical protein